MTNERRLNQYLQAKQRLRLLAEIVEERRAQAESMTARWGSVASGQPQADKLPRALERIEDARRNLAEQEEITAGLRAEVLSVIRREPDKRLRELLYRRYILGQTMADIAFGLQITPRYASKLHRQAVQGLPPSSQFPAGSL